MPLPPQTSLPAASSNDAVARVQQDPVDNRRFAIRGVSVGSAQVTIGAGVNALTVDVTVEARTPPADQINRVDVFQFEPEE